MVGAARPPRTVVLVGFMAAGKTSVGRRVADRLGYRFVDLDDEIERLAGSSVPEIFADGGEERFRQLEARATRRLSTGGRTVIATGGGWMARPELRDSWPDAVRVWLQVEPEEAVARLGERIASRPLLADADDPTGAARALLDRRRSAYERAEIHVDTGDRGAREVAREVVRRLSSGTP